MSDFYSELFPQESKKTTNSERKNAGYSKICDTCKKLFLTFVIFDKYCYTCNLKHIFSSDYISDDSPHKYVLTDDDYDSDS